MSEKRLDVNENSEDQSHIVPVEPEELPVAEVDEQPAPPATEDDEPIKLVEEPIAIEESSGKPAQRYTHIGRLGAAKAVEYKRALNITGKGATRCRIFHSRIAVDSLESMESRINEWLDGEEIDIKQVGHLIGTMEGKTPRPNIVVMVWY